MPPKTSKSLLKLTFNVYCLCFFAKFMQRLMEKLYNFWDNGLNFFNSLRNSYTSDNDDAEKGSIEDELQKIMETSGYISPEQISEELDKIEPQKHDLEEGVMAIKNNYDKSSTIIVFKKGCPFHDYLVMLRNLQKDHKMDVHEIFTFEEFERNGFSSDYDLLAETDSDSDDDDDSSSDDDDDHSKEEHKSDDDVATEIIEQLESTDIEIPDSEEIEKSLYNSFLNNETIGEAPEEMTYEMRPTMRNRKTRTLVTKTLKAIPLVEPAEEKQSVQPVPLIQVNNKTNSKPNIIDQGNVITNKKEWLITRGLLVYSCYETHKFYQGRIVKIMDQTYAM